MLAPCAGASRSTLAADADLSSDSLREVTPLSQFIAVFRTLAADFVPPVFPLPAHTFPQGRGRPIYERRNLADFTRPT